MKGYSTREVARIIGIPRWKVRRYARSGFLGPERGPRNAYRFSFQDVVLIRTAAELEAARVPPKRIHRALRALRNRLPEGRSLSEVRIVAEGDRVVVDEGARRWSPDSGQIQFDFRVSDLAAQVAPLDEAAAERARARGGGLRADEWYDLGCDFESSSPKVALEAYQRAVELDPEHADAHVNLGCLLHEAGRIEEALHHYEKALEAHPEHPAAGYNLGVVLEDMGRADEAIEAYRKAISSNPTLADAYFNLSMLYEKSNERAAALRLLQRYSELTRTK